VDDHLRPPGNTARYPPMHTIARIRFHIEIMLGPQPLLTVPERGA
jgi:hypothetical protein